MTMICPARHQKVIFATHKDRKARDIPFAIGPIYRVSIVDTKSVLFWGPKKKLQEDRASPDD